MINVIKELWFKWRAGVLLARVELLGYKRIALKEKQMELKKLSAEYFAKAKELRKLNKQD